MSWSLGWSERQNLYELHAAFARKLHQHEIWLHWHRRLLAECANEQTGEITTDSAAHHGSDDLVSKESSSKEICSAVPAAAPEEIVTSAKGSRKLPAKTTDLSNYLDQARLTNRQRGCVSLRLEYGLKVSAIAERLGISRKTVDEHLDAAKRRISAARIKDKGAANKARFNPEG